MMLLAIQQSGTRTKSPLKMYKTPPVKTMRPFSASSWMQLSCILHCICPVLWTTQDIHSPSQIVCATTMLESMNAVTFHMGRPHATMTRREPARHSAMPRDSRNMDSM
ncbi:hypothetical protein F7725_015026, partial [Dissostichus mawsoni]